VATAAEDRLSFRRNPHTSFGSQRLPMSLSVARIYNRAARRSNSFMPSSPRCVISIPSVLSRAASKYRYTQGAQFITAARPTLHRRSADDIN